MSSGITKEVERTLNELRKMGLKVHIEYDRDMKEMMEYAFIFIELDSLLKYISRRIRYPLKKIYVESGWVVIKLWKQIV